MIEIKTYFKRFCRLEFMLSIILILYILTITSYGLSYVEVPATYEVIEGVEYYDQNRKQITELEYRNISLNDGELAVSKQVVRQYASLLQTGQYYYCGASQSSSTLVCIEYGIGDIEIKLLSEI